MKLSTYQYQCDHCAKKYSTDNSWIACDEDDELTILGYFCSEYCRTEFLVKRGWGLDSRLNLRPPRRGE